ncbi:MAG: hypothetical protein AAFN13_05790 [Bacteroidota bacterium]
MSTKTDKKSAAIDLGKIESTPLSELRADTFLEALVQGKVIQYLPLWPEKKKYELYVEPENIKEVRFDRLRDILKGEKKKTELEIPPGGYFEPYRGERPRSLPFGPGEYERLVDRLADDIEGRLRERIG